ncbi:MAG: ABC transporter ATP-binding protein, partial [Deltaproteobacteria bacterium]|nr:ABC transporter ATP-binding protein [Deltaproteobacteria bacterium]
MTATLLRARQLTRRVTDAAGHVTILDQVSLDVATGERVALVGPSGSGKSTLLHILGALDPDYEGSVEIDGVRLEGLADHALAKVRNRTLGFVFQSYNLLGHLSALDNVLLPARFANETPDAQRAHELLTSVGLGDKAHRKPQTLSGGERQRVAIARALFHRPKLVLCDEPTGNLDRETGKELLGLFARLTEEGVALLIASHDQAIA